MNAIPLLANVLLSFSIHFHLRCCWRRIINDITLSPEQRFTHEIWIESMHFKAAFPRIDPGAITPSAHWKSKERNTLRGPLKYSLGFLVYHCWGVNNSWKWLIYRKLGWISFHNSKSGSLDMLRAAKKIHTIHAVIEMHTANKMFGLLFIHLFWWLINQFECFSSASPRFHKVYRFSFWF